MAYIGNKPEVGNFRKCDAITTSATATYNLLVGGVAVNPAQNQVICSLNGVVQSSGDSFTIASSQITFASTLASSDVIDFILILGDTLNVGTVSDDTISTAKLQANAVTTAKITDGNVTAAKFNADVISGQTELATTPADTDELLLSDAGVLKRIDYSHIKSTAGLTKIDSSVASGAVSTLTFSSFSDTYQNYLIQGTLSVDTTSADLVFKFNKSSGVEGGSNYWNAIAASYVDSSGTGCNYNRSVHSSNRMELCRDMVTDAARGVAFNIWCIDFRSTTKRASVIYQSCNMLNNNSFENITGTAMYNSSTTDVYNGIQFYPSSGNIDVREIYVYGVAK